MNIFFNRKDHIYLEQDQATPRGYKAFSMLNSAEHEIYHANKC